MKAKFILLLKSAMIQTAFKLVCLAAALSFFAAGCSTSKSSSSDGSSNSASPRASNSSSAVSRTVFQLPARHYSFYGIAMHRCYIVKTNTASAGPMMKVYIGGEVAHPGAIEVPDWHYRFGSDCGSGRLL